MKKIAIVLILMTVLMGCGAKDEKGDSSIEKEEKKIVTNISGVSDYSVTYSGIPELTEHSEVVVYGEVVDITYNISDGYFYLDETVRVIEPIKGEYQANDTILVSKEQGIVKVKDYLDSMAGEEGWEWERQNYSEYSDEELDDIYISRLEMNDVMSEIGQRGVYFLEKSAFYDTKGSYCRLTEAEAEYIEGEDGKFVRTVEMRILMEAAETMQETPEEEYAVRRYTLEEIKEEALAE